MAKGTKVKILFVAYGDLNTACTVCHNFEYYYDKFSSTMYEKNFSHSKRTNKFKILWEGYFVDKLDENSIFELVRLTHHAEGLYYDTEAEYVHVEVCIDGKWYGRG